MAIGRPRTFCTDQALDRAMQVFWRKGYEGATIADLTQAIGINPPSLYAAFGSKEELFRKALSRYADKRDEVLREALSKATAREGIKSLLRTTADFLTEKGNPACCLLVQGVSAVGDHAECIRDEMNRKRAEGEKAIRRRLKRAKAEGELPQAADPSTLARYFATITEGMAVQAAAGASRAELRKVAETAMKIWP